MKKKDKLSAVEMQLVEVQMQMLYTTAALRKLVEEFEKLARKTSGKKIAARHSNAKPVAAK